jgi:3-phenylpropionate/trans-cinnamate dioxygenase ferredoxin subunit
MALRTVPHAAPVLTERQRRILALMAEGRTNAEIGDQLGITLDGAKYHVSEILNKLGVDSREEAAAWWRRERSPSTRVVRFVSRAAALPFLLKLGGAAGIAAVVGGATVLAVAASGAGGSPPEDGVPEVATSSTPAPSTPTPTSTPTASGPTPSSTVPPAPSTPAAATAARQQPGTPTPAPAPPTVTASPYPDTPTPPPSVTPLPTPGPARVYREDIVCVTTPCIGAMLWDPVPGAVSYRVYLGGVECPRPVLHAELPGTVTRYDTSGIASFCNDWGVSAVTAAGESDHLAQAAVGSGRASGWRRAGVRLRHLFLESELADISISIRDNGPILIRGGAEVKDGAGNAFPSNEVTALCRCGHSGNKPFCDGSHNTQGFQSAPRAQA